MREAVRVCGLATQASTRSSETEEAFREEHMNVSTAIAEILKREGISFLIGYPVNPIIEAACLGRHSDHHRATGAHGPAYGRRREPCHFG